MTLTAAAPRPSVSVAVALDRPARWALRADGLLALVLGSVGLVTAAGQSESTGLPAPLLLAAAVALLPYGARALRAGVRGSTSRSGAEGLVLFNGVWVVVIAGLLLGGWIQPNPLGVAFVAAHVVIPVTVAVLTVRCLRR